MFGFLFRRAQATVDNAIGQVVSGTLVAVPLLVAAGFGTAALLRYLERSYGTDAAYLILACGFGVVSLVAVLVMNSRSRSASADPVSADSSERVDEETPLEQLGGMSKTDRELLMSALSTAGPYALPGLLRVVLRNLPLILAVLAAMFVMTRPDATDPPEADVQPGMQPAE